jgi:hypothetical protein
MAMTWTPDRVKLFHAVYQATARLSRYVPADFVGTGLYLRRNMDARYLTVTTVGTQRTLDPASVLGAITVRDATRDANRFTGIAPPLPGKPAVPVTRGGLYTSEDHTALLAEMYHYADPALPRDTYGKAPLLDMAAPKCFVRMKTVRELLVADLDSSAGPTQRFFRDVQGDSDVAAALAAIGYRSLDEAVFHGQDYSAGRGLGLGLASNPEIDGMRVTSARGFSTPDLSGETGNNVLLFAADQKPAGGLVQVASVHLVERDPSGAFVATHFLPGPSSVLVESGSVTL